MNRSRALLPLLPAYLVVFMSLTGRHIWGISHMLICEGDKPLVLLEWRQRKQVAEKPALISAWAGGARIRSSPPWTHSSLHHWIVWLKFAKPFKVGWEGFLPASPYLFFKVFSFFFWCGPFLKSLLNLLHHCFYLMLFFFFWPWGMWNLNSLIRDQPTLPALEGEVLTTGLQGSRSTYLPLFLVS